MKYYVMFKSNELKKGLASRDFYSVEDAQKYCKTVAKNRQPKILVEYKEASNEG